MFPLPSPCSLPPPTPHPPLHPTSFLSTTGASPPSPPLAPACSSPPKKQADLNARTYTEAQAAAVVRQCLSAIHHAHQKGICHRDLKFENILWESEASDAQIKVRNYCICICIRRHTDEARSGGRRMNINHLFELKQRKRVLFCVCVCVCVLCFFSYY